LGKSDPEETNQFLLQCFARHGLDGGWAIPHSRLMITNWKATGNHTWPTPSIASTRQDQINHIHFGNLWTKGT